MNSIKHLIIVVFLFASYIGLSQDMNFYWAQQYGSDEFASDIEAITTSKLNKVIAFTHFEDEFTVETQNFISEGGSDLLLFSTNDEGELEWAKSFGGINNQIAQKIQCDDDGHIYIMGKFNTSISIDNISIESQGSFDMYIAKFSPSGELIWLNTYGGPNSESLEAMVIRAQQIYLVGRFYNYTIIENDTIYSVDGTDVFLSKLNLDGEVIETLSFGGESVDNVSSVDVDIYGNIFLAGDFYQNIQIGEETFEAGDLLGLYMAKFNNNFDLQWAYQFVGSDLKPGLLLAVDNIGNISLLGNFSDDLHFGNLVLQTADFDEDIFMAHFSTDGEFNWAQRFYSNSMESPIALCVDRYGDSYLTGQYLDHIHFGDQTLQYNLCCGDPEIFFVKVNNQGGILHAEQLTGERSHIKSMDVPEVNQVILAGQFSEEFNIGEIILHSPTSYNVFIAYYKDDTWLSQNRITNSEITIHDQVFIHSLTLKDISENSNILVYNAQGQMIEEVFVSSSSIDLGQNWSKGLYFVQMLSVSKELKTVKLIKQ